MKDYRLLVKFPTRGRPETFFMVLDRYCSLANRKDALSFLVTCDLDDKSMNNDAVRDTLAGYRNLQAFYGHSQTKIEAINRDMGRAGDYDIILLASDDMIPEEHGYDEIIREKMRELYPDTDGVLWFFDGYNEDVNTLCILGRKYYERFGYIYHPSYCSFWCDNEFRDVASMLGRQAFTRQVIIRHVHPDWIRSDPKAMAIFRQFHPGETGFGIDQTFNRNLPFLQRDQQTYCMRKQNGFDLRLQ